MVASQLYRVEIDLKPIDKNCGMPVKGVIVPPIVQSYIPWSYNRNQIPHLFARKGVSLYAWEQAVDCAEILFKDRRNAALEQEKHECNGGLVKVFVFLYILLILSSLVCMVLDDPVTDGYFYNMFALWVWGFGLLVTGNLFLQHRFRLQYRDECPILLAVARATIIPDSPPARGRDFERWKAAATAAQNAAVTDHTRSQRSHSWKRYENFLSIVGPGKHDPFLRELNPEDRIDMFACFAAAIRKGFDGCPGFANGGRTRRQAGTVRSTLDVVAQPYRANKLVSPIHDCRGRLDSVLAAQLRGFTLVEDPETRRPHAIPAAVVAIVAKADASEVQRAVGPLVVGAFFFAMRSCEYSKVTGSRRAQIIWIGDLDFRKDGCSIDIADVHQLQDADTVSVTYRIQKNGDRGVTVTQHRTDGLGQALLCPVRSFANLVTRVSQYKLSDHKEWASAEDRPMNLVVTGSE